ncbi:nucleoporin NUP35-like isoform X2 [Ostrea edulis]|uniref:nucleoporin NUP35-like isoform X2 n=1 Tax=Ostrea edulis TaxID=37623 RepID=UPI00209576FB|nr:nucleoporin NUP35-like isoform X2 [Ostrea edulis]
MFSSQGLDAHGSFGMEPMTMGSPASPTSPHQSQFLPSFLMGESIHHSPGPQHWSTASSPSSSQRGSSMTSPTSHHAGSRPRAEVLRPKERIGAPPTKSLMSSPTNAMSSSFHTPHTPHHDQSLHMKSAHTPGIGAPPTASILHSETPQGTNQSFIMDNTMNLSPAQLDPFYTQGEMLTADDALDETWVTVFGFQAAAASYFLQQFSQYGNILKYEIASEGNWMHLHYQSKLQAKKALSKDGKIFNNCVMIGVKSCIDKAVMDRDRQAIITEEHSLDFNTSTTTRNAPIRPLTAAYRAAKSEHEKFAKYGI